MSEIKRYYPTWEGTMEETASGGYVSELDYEAKEAECNRLTAINKTLLDACEKVKDFIDIDSLQAEFEIAIQEAKKEACSDR